MNLGKIESNSTYHQKTYPRTRENAAVSDFSKTISNKVSGLEGSKSDYQVYLKTDDMLYSGGNGTGLSFYIKYATDSTEENPVMIAKGIDENGKEFEERINVKDIDLKSASIIEMRALEAYTGADKLGGFTSLPLSTGEMGLYDKRDFMSMFDNTIQQQKILGRKSTAGFYEQSMQMYWNFINSTSSDKHSGWNA